MLTSEQITALAPDPASLSAGRSLSSFRKWVSVAGNEKALWGECQGSGKLPYQTQIDLSTLSTKCSCPSRKFPCKHSLGLMFIAVAEPGKVTGGTFPDWVKEWIEAREVKAAKAVAKAESKADAAANASPEEAAELAASAEKRVKKREEKVSAALDEMDQWLADLIRVGLSSCQQHKPGFWKEKAARLVDGQAGALARQVEDFGGIVVSGTGWQERLLEKLSLLSLLSTAYRNISKLPEGSQADVRRYVGWTLKQEEVLARGFLEVDDQWRVLGDALEEDERLTTLRTWVHGIKSGRVACLINFAVQRRSLVVEALPGTEFRGKLCFYPSAYPQRAIIKERREGSIGKVKDLAPTSVEEALKQYASALSANPWQEGFPMRLAGVVIIHRDKKWFLHEASTGTELVMDRASSSGWRLLSLSGGHPLDVMGEWNGSAFLPLSLLAEGRFLNLSHGASEVEAAA